MAQPVHHPVSKSLNQNFSQNPNEGEAMKKLLQVIQTSGTGSAIYDVLFSVTFAGLVLVVLAALEKKPLM